jgi:hypothetical protein
LLVCFDPVNLGHYVVGTSREGADAYPPLILFKCLLLQKWFHIDSDPELESQINDRISFKRFLGLSFGDPSPDHSTFSRPAPLQIIRAIPFIPPYQLRNSRCPGVNIAK